jgi:hypothetical protein
MHERGGHNIGAEVNQEIIVEQRSGSLPQTRTAERSRSLAVDAPAKGLRIGIRSGSAQESDDHREFPES